MLTISETKFVFCLINSAETTVKVAPITQKTHNTPKHRFSSHISD